MNNKITDKNEDFTYVNTEKKVAKSIIITYEDGTTQEVDMKKTTYVCIPWDEYNTLKQIYNYTMQAMEAMETNDN